MSLPRAWWCIRTYVVAWFWVNKSSNVWFWKHYSINIFLYGESLKRMIKPHEKYELLDGYIFRRATRVNIATSINNIRLQNWWCTIRSYRIFVELVLLIFDILLKLIDSSKQIITITNIVVLWTCYTWPEKLFTDKSTL